MVGLEERLARPCWRARPGRSPGSGSGTSARPRADRHGRGPRSASSTPTSVSFSKWCPLATSCVPMIRSYSPRSISAKRSRSCALLPMSERQDHRPRIGEARRRLLGDALDARPDRRPACRPRRIRRRPWACACSWPQWWHISTPRKRCSTSQAEQSGHWYWCPQALAQRQRRIAAPVEEQQRLLAAVERREHLARQLRRDPLALFRRLLAHVDGGDVGHRRLGEARGQQHMGIAPGIGIVARFRPTASPTTGSPAHRRAAPAPPPCRGRGS